MKLFILLAGIAVAQQPFPSVATTVTLTHTAGQPAVTYIGSNSNGVDTFNNIRYGRARRLEPPVLAPSAGSTFTWNAYPTICPQRPVNPLTQSIQGKSANGAPATVTASISSLVTALPIATPVAGPQSEDCLFLKVQRSVRATNTSNWPVLVFFHGGGFEIGGYDQNWKYDATDLLNLAANAPFTQGRTQNFIFVSVNYRLNGFGFLGGSDIFAAQAGNLGLRDQRTALEWLRHNIVQFGGSPTNITIMGSGSGGHSVLDQMVLYGGNNLYQGRPLFSHAILNSGSILPTQPLDSKKPNIIYQDVVNAAGCAGSLNTLNCLKTIAYSTFRSAVFSVSNQFSYSSIGLNYVPRADNVTLLDSPDRLVLSGRFTRIPIIVNDQEDEATIYSLAQAPSGGIQTWADLDAYTSSVIFQGSPANSITQYNRYYIDNQLNGSPFRTNNGTNIYPQYKRLTALLGDFYATLQRRVLLTAYARFQVPFPAWTALSCYFYGPQSSFLGTFHGTDNFFTFATNAPAAIPSVAKYIQLYIISFVVYKNPNTGRSPGDVFWPVWTFSQREQLNFTNSPSTFGVIVDNYRDPAFNFLYGGPLRLW